MSSLLKKNLWIILGLTFIFVLYLVSRIYNIMTLPIFTDEAIYTRWTQIARLDANWRFISLTDGKQPSFVWIGIIFMKFIRNPLLAMRMVSVASGILSIVGLYFLSYEVFKNKYISLLTSFLYAIFPFALVYDRMALYESLVAASMIWSLYWEILLIKKSRLDIAFILGVVLGFAVLTKTIGFLAIDLMPFLFILFDFKQKKLKERAIKLIGLLCVSIVIAYAMYAILRLSPFYHIIDEKNSIFVYPVSEWLKHRPEDMLKDFLSNFRGLFDWFLRYMTLPFILLVISSFFIKTKYTREKLLLLIWFIAPFFALTVFGRTLYPRYIFFMTMPLLVLVSFALYFWMEKLKNNILKIALFLVVIAYPLYMNFFIITNFAHASIPKSDLDQYSNGWPAGGGVKESLAFFRKQSESGPIFVATEGTFGLMPNAYEIYFQDMPNLMVKGYWPIQDKVPEEVIEKSKQMPTYFVFYQDCPSCPSQGEAPPLWNLKKVVSYPKGNGTSRLTVYQVISSK